MDYSKNLGEAGLIGLGIIALVGLFNLMCSDSEKENERERKRQLELEKRNRNNLEEQFRLFKAIIERNHREEEDMQRGDDDLIRDNIRQMNFLLLEEQRAVVSDLQSKLDEANAGLADQRATLSGLVPGTSLYESIQKKIGEFSWMIHDLGELLEKARQELENRNRQYLQC